jgi:hypothetical protein
MHGSDIERSRYVLDGYARQGRGIEVQGSARRSDLQGVDARAD